MKANTQKVMRLFLAFIAMVSTVLLPVGASAEEATSRAGKFTMDLDLSSYESDQSVRLWIPYAASNEFQTISNIEVKIDEATATKEVNKDDKGNEILYVEFKPEAKERKVTYSFDVERKEVKRPELKEEGTVDAEEFKDYLQGATLMPIDGDVKETADKITEGKTTVLDKSKAIYDWIYDNMERNEEVVGCGTGDVLQLLKNLNGKCTDIHSVYVGLARAAGIPAREVFGVRLSKDAQADVTKAQHCWAEFYLPGTGWVAVDVADVLKAILKENLTKDSEKALQLKDYYWGNLDPIRVGFSTGRDLKLVPEQADGPLNQFGYPYAEVDGKAIDFYQPDTFKYTINFTEAQ